MNSDAINQLILAILILWGIVSLIIWLITGVEFETAFWIFPLLIVICGIIYGVIFGITILSGIKEQPLVKQINDIWYDEAARIHRDKRGKKKSKYKTETKLTPEEQKTLNLKRQQRQSLKHRLKELNFHFDMDLIEFMSDEAILEITKLIKNIKVTPATTRFDPSTLPDNGHEFEHWVAKNLNQSGWNAKVTSGSGDQGIDVIATKNGRTIGLQCKLYSSPVGNKAVQEAYAGKAFHQMDAVGVITNTSYTKSARALATDTGVKLLPHHDIPNLYEKMFSE